MTDKKLEFDGKEFVTLGEKLADKEVVTFKDEEYEEDFKEETLEQLVQTAQEYLKENTPKELGDELERRFKSAEVLANTNEKMKQHYINMQNEADRKMLLDGGEDKTNPNYYQTRERESIDIMELKYGTRAVMAFCILNSERYEYRMGNKQIQDDNAKLDLEKADWYLNKYVELRGKLGTREEIKGMSSLISDI